MSRGGATAGRPRRAALAALLVLAVVGGVIAFALTRSGDDEAQPTTAPTPGPGTVVLEDEGWECEGHVDLDLVKVTIRTVRVDAISLGADCNGSIDRIEVETWVRDGVKVRAHEQPAHDLTIGGGYVRCHARGGADVHQDGIQVMGGSRITFRDLEISCSSEPNAQLFINGVNDGLPTDVLCERCTLGGGAATTLIVGRSVRSGTRDTLICEGRFHSIRVKENAESPVDEGSRELPPSDERCTVAD